jgi:chemosensory pili system protein ChpA (sensor histidine kinase/response regulator)
MAKPVALVVEDEAALRVIYDRLLRGLGWDVLLAKDGQEGIDALQDHTPRLIFLDMLLPFVNGVQVIHFITKQERLQNTHVVIVSSAAEYQHHVTQLHSAEFYLKPILATQIREIGLRVLTTTP